MNLFGDEPNTDTDEDYSVSAGFDDTLQTDGLNEPQSSDFFIGHQAVEKQFLDLWHAGKMPHAVILNGIKGIGKATFAYRLARFVLKETDAGNSGGLFGGEDTQASSMAIDNDDPVFRKVASGGHPDLKIVTRPFDEKKGKLKTIIGRDELRVITPFFRQKSAMGGWQVVIIDDANMMSQDSQNVVLKILEEPPEKSLLILVTHGVGGLIPTIRSRCRFVPFHPLEDTDITNIISKSDEFQLSEHDSDFIQSVAQGSAGQALTLVEDVGMETLQTYLDLLLSVESLSNHDRDLQALAIAKTGSNHLLDHFLYIVRWWIDQQVYMAVRNENEVSVGGQTLKILSGHSLESLLKLQEAVEAHIKTCQIGNLDARYMIFKLLGLLKNGQE